MKGLLVASLVLGMGAAAAAGLYFDKHADNPTLGIVDEGGTGAEAVVLGVSEFDTYDIWVTPRPWPIIGPPDVYIGLFDMAVIGRPDLGVMNLWLLGWGGAGDRLAGTNATVTPSDVSGWGDADLGLGIAVLLNADAYEQIDIAYVVPEPLTLGLLGVGVLFLRRQYAGGVLNK